MSCKTTRFKFNRKYLGIMKQELNKKKVNKRTGLIEKVSEIRNDIYQEVVRNCVDSMTERIMKWIQNRGDKSDH